MTVDAALVQLDLAGKVRLLTGASFFSFTGDEAIGLTPIAMSDGPSGVKGQSQSGGAPAALLPNATALASTWDEQLLADVGRFLAEDAQRNRTHVVLGPTINLHRSPLGGRVFECFSEDPLLTGRLAASYVRGLQDQGVGACLKHLVGNEAETDRHTVDVRIDEATLREVYLLPFEIAVADADAWLLMAAYNRVDGVPATEHDRVLNQVVKGEWGYAGLVVSDFFATHSTAPAITGGLDVVLPGPFGPWGQQLVAAVEAGEVSPAVVDAAVRRVLLLAERVGALGTPREWPEVPGADDPARTAQLREWAAAGMTVLRNDGALPLAAGTRVALAGLPATETLLMGGGSAEVSPPHQVSVLDGLTAALGPAVTWAGGVQLGSTPPAARPGFVVDPVDGTPGVRLQVVGADGRPLVDEHLADSRRVVGWGGELAGPGTRVRLTARVDHTGPLQLGVVGLGSWTVTAGDQRATVQVDPVTGVPGESLLAPPHRVADLAVDGPVEVTAEVDLGDLEHAMVGLVARPAPVPDADAIAAAASAAAGADVAVVVVGLTAEQETESRDKTTLALPGAQDALVEAVAATARRTVVVVNAATPVLMPWLDRVDAVLVAGLPGQEGGHAVAAALLGELEPAGRLVTTWPAADGASPAWSVTPTDGVLTYAEGAFVGHRGHAAGHAPAPAAWFGAGLGYGSWDYREASVDTAGPTPVVTATIANTSTRDSREVVQVYLQPADPARPVRLVGWRAAVVPAGATAQVTVTCDPRVLRRWDGAGWVAEDRGELMLARGLGDIRLRLPLG
ncbi:beta-glucosidase [Klenkia soli]|uniref:Beta-glucosidase n=1 Tax=Klenkia soli TaxID=1052260 RepID=A0A1H0L4G1_9ACTN|nr:glycoside hydrolase family 3 C-terminal domain-containing protein [Klenkia soli]SDO63117.1 beta-glucosidase [Klenkia soli]